MEMILGIVGAITGLFALAISFFSYRHTRIEAVNDFFNRFLDPESIKARRIIRTLGDYNIADLNEQQETAFSSIITEYSKAGLFVKKKQLPFWVFDMAVGYKVMNFYEKLKPYINERRKNEPGYAFHFEYLYDRLKKAKHPAWKDSNDNNKYEDS